MSRKKILKILFRWTLFSIVLQFSMFFLLNTYFFKSDGTIKSKKITFAKEDTNKVAHNVSIPSEAKDAKMSFDGKYMSYILDGELKVVNVRNGDIIDVSVDSYSKLLNYTWLKDRNRIFLTQLDEGIINLYYYDLSKNHKEKIPISSEIKGNKHTKVKSIEASTLTNVTYLNIEKEGYKKVYRLDINLDIKPIELFTDAIGEIRVIPHEDILIYEDTNNHHIYAKSPGKNSKNSNKKITKEHNGKYTLLSVDNNDVIYIGVLDDSNNITEIKYGSLSDNFSNWKHISLDTPLSKDNIIITYNGQVLENNKAKSCIVNLVDNKKYSYKGELLQVYDDGYAFIEDGHLKEEPLK